MPPKEFMIIDERGKYLQRMCPTSRASTRRTLLTFYSVTEEWLYKQPLLL